KTQLSKGRHAGFCQSAGVVDSKCDQLPQLKWQWPGQLTPTLRKRLLRLKIYVDFGAFLSSVWASSGHR
ncbi:hypothetical protein BaRGS_00021186, partial [Batillaria attramentaria]